MERLNLVEHQCFCQGTTRKTHEVSRFWFVRARPSAHPSFDDLRGRKDFHLSPLLLLLLLRLILHTKSNPSLAESHFVRMDSPSPSSLLISPPSLSAFFNLMSRGVCTRDFQTSLIKPSNASDSFFLVQCHWAPRCSLK